MKIREDNFIENLRIKNPKALSYIIDKYGGLVNSIITRILLPIGDKGLIEECIDDVFIGIWENGYKFNGDKDKFKSWVAAIAKFKGVDYFRKHSKIKNIETIYDNLVDKKNLEESFINDLEAKRLIDIIMSYDEPDKSIFIRKFLLGETSREISKAIGITISNINTRIFRGRKKIKKEFYNEKEVL